MSKYGFFIEEYCAIVGADGAGVVVQVGEGVNNLAKGDRVWVVYFLYTNSTV